MEVAGKTFTCSGFKSAVTVDRLVRGCEVSRAWFLQAMPNVDELRDQRMALSQSLKGLVSLVITPSTVPDFTIPQSYNSYCSTASPPGCRRNGSIGSDSSRDDQNEASDSETRTHSTTPASESALLRRPEGRRSECMVRCSSDPSTHEMLQLSLEPKRVSGKAIRRSHTISYEMIDEGCGPQRMTNSDPRSLAALSLQHIKTKTKYGFETLTECPTTARKESLFHGPHSSSGVNLTRMQSKLVAFRDLQNKKCGSRDSESNDPNMLSPDSSNENLRRTRSRRRTPASQLAPLGVSLSSRASMDSVLSTPRSSPITSQNTSMEMKDLQLDDDIDVNSSQQFLPSSPTVAEERRRRFRHAHTGAVSLCDDTVPWSSPGIQTLRAPEAAEGDDAHSLRRLSGCNISLNEEDVQQLWRVSALTNTVGVSRRSTSESSCEDNYPVFFLSGHKKKAASKLRFSLEYLMGRRQLLVHIQEAIDLPGLSDSTSSFVKLHLHPLNNSQRHTSARQSRDPVFDQIFAFSDITMDKLSQLKLRLKVVKKGSMLRRSEPIGELEVSLSELDFTSDCRHVLLRNIETEEIPKELGRLQTKICFHANCETLDVTLLNIKDLPTSSITGTPDPYVCLELRQPNRPDVRLQSKVKKKVTSCGINETFSFHMSPRIEDLNYTALFITVYGREVIRSDRVIGEIRLGFGATEKSEFDQWNKVLCCPGCEVTSWHMLMEEQ